MYRARALKIDANQPELIKFMQKLGASVQSLGQVGDGCPDLLVGFGGKNYLMEVKDGAKKPSARLLTKDQGDWRAAWSGQYAVVECKEDCLSVLGVRLEPESFELSGDAWTLDNLIDEETKKLAAAERLKTALTADQIDLADDLEQIEQAAEKLVAAARGVC